MLHTPAAFPRLIIADLGDAATFDSVLYTVPLEKTVTANRRNDNYGTPAYAAPEVLAGKFTDWKHDGTAKGRRRVAKQWFAADKAADLWAVGSKCAINRVSRETRMTRQRSSGDA